MVDRADREGRGEADWPGTATHLAENETEGKRRALLLESRIVILESQAAELMRERSAAAARREESDSKSRVLLLESQLSELMRQVTHLKTEGAKREAEMVTLLSGMRDLCQTLLDSVGENANRPRQN